MKKPEIVSLRKIKELRKELESFPVWLLYRDYPWYDKLLEGIRLADNWLYDKENQEEIRAKMYNNQQWQQHQHLINIGKCGNTCDDWLACSENWKFGEEWAKIFEKELKGI
jgi:hypothetical protein